MQRAVSREEVRNYSLEEVRLNQLHVKQAESPERGELTRGKSKNHHENREAWERSLEWEEGAKSLGATVRKHCSHSTELLLSMCMLRNSRNSRKTTRSNFCFQ